MSQYKSYEQKLRRQKAVKDAIHNKRLVIGATLGVVTTMTATVLFTKGITTGVSDMPEQITYGETYDPNASGFLSGATKILYSVKGENNWTETKPTMVGTYEVKGTNKNGVGITYSGKKQEFTIVPKDLTATVVDDTIAYGDTARIEFTGLIDGDSVSEFKSVASFPGDDLISTTYLDVNNTLILNADGQDVTQCYNILTPEKDVHITQRKLTVAIDGKEKDYDGTALSSQDYTIGLGSLADGDKLTFKDAPSITEIGSIENDVTVTVTNSLGQDVTHLYDMDVSYGELTVTKRKLLVSTNSLQKTYDGKAFESTEFTYDLQGSLLGGDTAVISYEHIGMWKAGTVSNTASFHVYNEEGVDVTSSYYDVSFAVGTIEIDKADITYSTKDVDTVYTGEDVLDQSITVEEGQLASTDTFTYEEAQTYVDGSHENFYKISIHNDYYDEDATDCYNTEVQYGTINIRNRTLKIETLPYTAAYDGETHTADEFAVVADSSYDGLREGDTVEFINPITIKDADVYDNEHTAADFKVYDDHGNDITEHYDITVENSACKIDKVDVSIQYKNITKVYDGEALDDSDDCTDRFDVISGGAVTGETLKAKSTYKFDLVNAGTYSNNDGDMTLSVVDDSTGVDTTSNYRFTSLNPEEESHVTIEKRRITVSTVDVSKVYDGTTSLSGLTLYELNGADTQGNEDDFGLLSGHTFSAPTISTDKTDVNFADADKTQVTSYGALSDSGSSSGAAQVKKVTKDGKTTYEELDATDISKNNDEDDTNDVTVVGSQTASFLMLFDATIKDASGKDVTSNYAFTYINSGKLTINKRNLTIAPRDGVMNFTYDSTAHGYGTDEDDELDEKAEYNYDEDDYLKSYCVETGNDNNDGLASGQYLKKLTNGATVTTVKDSNDATINNNAKPTFDVLDKKPTDATAESVADNYNISVLSSKFNVKQREITISSNNEFKKYDNTPLIPTTENEDQTSASSAGQNYTITYGSVAQNDRLIFTEEMTSTNAPTYRYKKSTNGGFYYEDGTTEITDGDGNVITDAKEAEAYVDAQNEADGTDHTILEDIREHKYSVKIVDADDPSVVHYDSTKQYTDSSDTETYDADAEYYDYAVSMDYGNLWIDTLTLVASASDKDDLIYGTDTNLPTTAADGFQVTGAENNYGLYIDYSSSSRIKYNSSYSTLTNSAKGNLSLRGYYTAGTENVLAVNKDGYELTPVIEAYQGSFTDYTATDKPVTSDNFQCLIYTDLKDSSVKDELKKTQTYKVSQRNITIKSIDVNTVASSKAVNEYRYISNGSLASGDVLYFGKDSWADASEIAVSTSALTTDLAVTVDAGTITDVTTSSGANHWEAYVKNKKSYDVVDDVCTATDASKVNNLNKIGKVLILHKNSDGTYSNVTTSYNITKNEGTITLY